MQIKCKLLQSMCDLKKKKTTLYKGFVDQAGQPLAYFSRNDLIGGYMSELNLSS
jgi:hypothetical protein